MQLKATIIQYPGVDFDILLSLANQVLDYSPSEGVDKHRLVLSDAEKFLSILAALKRRGATPELYEHLLTHVSYSLLVLGLEVDMREVIELCSGMPYVLTDTKRRGIVVCIITGNLTQWRSAVVAGLLEENEIGVRSIFNSIYDAFVQEGVNLWKEYNRKTVQNFLRLEKK
jgi:hypothetical protein